MMMQDRSPSLSGHFGVLYCKRRLDGLSPAFIFSAWWLLALALFLAADLVYLGSEWAKPAFSIL